MKRLIITTIFTLTIIVLYQFIDINLFTVDLPRRVSSELFKSLRDDPGVETEIVLLDIEYVHLDTVKTFIELLESLEPKSIGVNLCNIKDKSELLDKYLSEIAENAVQPSVRAKAYRSQLEGRMVWVEGRKWEWTDIRYCKGEFKPIVAERTINMDTLFLEILNKSSSDRSPIVRRVAAEFLIREFDVLGEESLRLANLFASNKSPSVAERGRFALKRFEESHL